MSAPAISLRAAAVVLAAAAALSADVFNMPAGQASLEFVLVANPGNAPDPATGLGAVGRLYLIGKYHVTAAQYVEFLNAVAAADTYGVYCASMANAADCAIHRTGIPGSYIYTVDPTSANRPANFTSFGAAARFCNWLANGQPTGNQDLGTTEDGSYYLNGANDNTTLKAVVRKPDAVYVLPTQDEWYKAAYHKNDGVTGHYWSYPTQSDEPPVAEVPPGSSEPPGSANYMSIMGVNQNLTDVGAYLDSPGPYGTFDQGGLLYQWTDSLIAPSYAGYSGFAMLNSSFLSSSSLQLRSGYRIWPWSPMGQYNFFGFRVARLCLHVQADLDEDGDVDVDDLDHFLTCVSGPGIPQIVPACINARLDSDSDVDQSDFGLLQRCYSGRDVPANPACWD